MSAVAEPTECLELEARGDGSILDDHDDAILDNDAVALALCLCHALLVDQLHVGADARVLVNYALLDVPAQSPSRCQELAGL